MADVRKLKNWKTINNGSIQRDRSKGRVAKKANTVITRIYMRKTSADLNRSGSFTVLDNILRIILPLKVWNPMFMTIPLEQDRLYTTLDP